MATEFEDLIHRRLSGLLSETEVAFFQSALSSDADLQRLYLDYVNLDVALSSKAASDQATRELLIGLPPGPETRGRRRRSVAAAVVGVGLVLFGASLGYAFVTRRPTETQLLLRESFEDDVTLSGRGLPNRFDIWAGDLRIVQEPVPDVPVADGQRMVVLPPVEQRKFSYARRFLDVSTLADSAQGVRTRRIEVTARFHGARPGVPDVFQIRLAAFARDIESARAIWNSGNVDEEALIHVAKTLKVKAGDSGWVTLRSVIDLPRGAKCLLISLGAGVADEGVPKTDHYLDDIHVRLITQDVTP